MIEPGPEAHAAAHEQLVERLAEGHWREAWPNQGYDWSEENEPTREAHRRGARRCVAAFEVAGLRLVPAETDPSDAEQAALWMAEAWHQATMRDANHAEARLLEAERDQLRTRIAELEAAADTETELITREGTDA